MITYLALMRSFAHEVAKMPSDPKSMYIFLLKCKLSQMQNATGLRYSAHTVNLEHFARVYFRESRVQSFVKIKPREMAISLCRLLIQVNHVPVAKFQRRKYVF